MLMKSLAIYSFFKAARVLAGMILEGSVSTLATLLSSKGVSSLMQSLWWL